MPGLADENAIALKVQTAMLNAVGKSVREVVKVDMPARMKELGLFDVFPSDVWPEPAAVRDLASLMRARAKVGEPGAVVFAKLRK